MDAAVSSSPLPAAPSPVRGGTGWRLRMLLALLVAESALAISLQMLGWFETGGLLRQVACAMLALLPLAAAIAVVVRRNFRFGMQAMLIATALLTLFMWVSVMPLYEALASRRGTQALAAQKTSVHDYCSNEEYFKRIGYDPRPPAPAKPASHTLPAWLRPLAGEALRQPMDAAVREVKLVDDGQAAAFAEHVERFRSLTYVGVLSRGVSAGGVAALCDALPKVTQLVQLHVTCPVPPGLLRSAPVVRCVWIDSGTRAVNQLGPEVMNDLASLKELRHLDLRHVRISDADLQLLAQSGSLRQIWLRAEGVTPAGIEQLRTSMPKCDVKLIAPPNNVILPTPGTAPSPTGP